MLIENGLKDELKKFINESQKLPVEDQSAAIDKYCSNFERVVYEAIKSITITIPPGFIRVEGSPSFQTNIDEIILKGVIT